MPEYSKFADDINLDKLGKRKVVDGVLVWEPPKDLDPGFAKLMQAAVEELNKKVKAGELVLNKNGEVK
jgi:hypothetical protein